jgi:hypothetical protein
MRAKIETLDEGRGSFAAAALSRGWRASDGRAARSLEMGNLYAGLAEGAEEMRLTRVEVMAGVVFAVVLTAAFLLLVVLGGNQVRDPDPDPGIWRNCGAMTGHKYLTCGVEP